MKKQFRREGPRRFLPCRFATANLNTETSRNLITRTGKFYAYIVQCRKGTYYTGSTNSLEERVKLHNQGHGAKYLRGKLPVKLVYAKEYRYYMNALHAERNIKKMKRREKDELVRIYNNTPQFSSKTKRGV